MCDLWTKSKISIIVSQKLSDIKIKKFFMSCLYQDRYTIQDFSIKSLSDGLQTIKKKLAEMACHDP